MLSQVAGRAGRSHKRGQVLIQTYNPDQEILKHVQNQSLATFCTTEMKERQRLDYPPFGRLIRITFKHRNRELVENGAQWFANVIRQSYEKTVLGLRTSSCQSHSKSISSTIVAKDAYSQRP